MLTVRRTVLLAISGLALGCASPVPRAFDGTGVPTGARIAILPFVNYTTNRDAPDRVLPVMAVELSRQKGLTVVDAGVVEQATAEDPWLSPDRMPPDVIDRIGQGTQANALLVGNILAYGYQLGDTPQVPEVSIAVKLLETPGGRCLWSAVHSRGGSDREKVFGIGRVNSLERLAQETVAELVATLPVRPDVATSPPPPTTQGATP